MTEDARNKWDRIYDARSEEAGQHQLNKPARVLVENIHLLPKKGEALEIACGMGGNAVLLAEQGLQVSAFDISKVAIDGLNSYAAEQGLPLKAIVRDVMAEPLSAASYDVIVVAHFLERALIPQLIAALRPGGVIFYQTFARTAVSSAGPSNAEYRLEDNEFLSMFSGFKIRMYREEGLLGDVTQGFRDLAMIVAEKSSGRD